MSDLKHIIVRFTVVAVIPVALLLEDGDVQLQRAVIVVADLIVPQVLADDVVRGLAGQSNQDSLVDRV